MTCIVVVKTNLGIAMAGDSAAVRDYDLERRSQEKFFRVGEFMIAACGSIRMKQILRYSFHPPAIPDWDVWKYMSTSFITELRRAFKDAGWLMIYHNQEWSGEFLVTVRGQIFCVNSDFGIGVMEDPFFALGCGAPYALGYLSGVYDANKDPEVLAREAVLTSEKYSAGVRAPVRSIVTQ